MVYYTLVYSDYISSCFCIYKQVLSWTEYFHHVNDNGRYYVVCIRRKARTFGKFKIEEISCERA